MTQKPIRMTEGFRKANIKAGQLTDADATGEWLRPEGSDSSSETNKEFEEILKRVSTPASPDQEG